MKILLVDDEEIVLKGIQTIISQYGDGWEITGLCDSGFKALESIKCARPDVVIADIGMPGMSGMEFSEKLVAFDESIIIILLTGYADFKFAQKALTLRVFEYLVKPTRYTEIIDCLRRAEKKIATCRTGAPARAAEIENTYSQAIEKALAYIEEHYAEDISLKVVSGQAFLSPWYFSELFKKEVGKSLTDYILHLRIMKAKSLIANKALPLYQIASMVGINTPGYFSQIYRKATGLSPKEYRHSLKK